MNINIKENLRVVPESPARWTAEDLNQIINEIQNVIVEYGMQPDSADVTQLKKALDNLNTRVVQIATNASAIYTDEQIAAALSGAIHFTGYVDTTQPTDEALHNGSLWINAAAMPTTFPVTGVKQYDKSANTWSDTDDYAPSIFDLWSLASDSHGYYWFGGEWNIMDFNVELADYQTRNEKNMPNGYAGTDENGQIFTSALPSMETMQLNGYIGEIKIMGGSAIRPGILWLDGAEYPITAFAKFINEDLDAHGIPYGTYTQWQAAYDNNMGNVGFIAVDKENGTFKMMRIDERVAVMQNLTPANIGLFGRDQIVNMTGTITLATSASYIDGAFYTDNVSIGSQGAASTGNGKKTWFDASRVVATGDRVQPRHVQFPFAMVVANVLVPASETQYQGFVEGLNSKANVNGDNIIKEEFKDALRKRWESEWYTAAASSTVSFTHNLNLSPAMQNIKVLFMITTAVSGYAVGDIININYENSGTNSNFSMGIVHVLTNNTILQAHGYVADIARVAKTGGQGNISRANGQFKIIITED